MARECNIWSKFRHHCVHEINGRSSDVVCKIMFHLVCWYIFNYVFPPNNSADLVIPIYLFLLFLYFCFLAAKNKSTRYWRFERKHLT